MPIGVAMLPSWVWGSMPLAPILAGMPVPTGSHPDVVRCQTSIFASEPPVPTTEITWLALPTLLANQGAGAALPIGAPIKDSAVKTAAISTLSRRMGLIMSDRRRGWDTIGCPTDTACTTSTACTASQVALLPRPSTIADERGKSASRLQQRSRDS